MEKEGLLEDVEWFLDHLAVEKGASPHTVSNYRRDLKSVVEVLGASHLTVWADLTNRHLALLDPWLDSATSTRTAQRRVSALRSFLRFLKRQGIKITVDLPSTAGFKTPKRLPKALPAPVLAQMIETDQEDPTGKRNQALVALLFGCGLRITEAIELSIRDYDQETRAIRVVGKRQKVRVVPVPEEVHTIIQNYLLRGRPELQKRATDQLLLSARGNKLSRQVAYDIVNELAKTSGKHQPTGPHTLRHSYAVTLLKGGADLRVVQELLGHASVATTQVYTQLEDEAVSQNYRRAHPRS